MGQSDKGAGFVLGGVVSFFTSMLAIRVMDSNGDSDSLVLTALGFALGGGLIGHALQRVHDEAGTLPEGMLESPPLESPPLESPPLEPSPLAAGEMACPRCPGVALQDRVCPGCKGDLWDAATVQEFARTRLHFESVEDLRQFASSEPDSKLACPACAQQMKLVRLKGQQVDLCLGCGSLWADDAETAAIEAAANLTR